MISKQEIIDNYSIWKTELDDRFGRRFGMFLENKDLDKIGFSCKDENREVKAWTKENILTELKDDLEFAWEKACNGRGISSSLMVDVVQKWCNILENGLHYDLNYTDYGKSFLQEVDKKYGWHLTDVDVSEEGYANKMMVDGQKAIRVL